MKRILSTLSILTIAAFFISLFLGSYSINPERVIHLLFHPESNNQESIVLWQIRLPRALVAVISGAVLAVASVLFQNTFRNRLADPAIIGISPAAAFGTAIALNIGGLANNQVAISLIALLITWMTITLLFYLEHRSVVANSLIILGIAINALFTALVAVVAQLNSNPQSRSFLSWSMGSLATSTWSDFYLVIIGAIIAIVFSVFFARKIDLLYISDVEVRSLGINPMQIKIVAVFVAGTIIALTTSVLGVISFIGLLVPNIVKALGIYLHRELILVSAITGSFIMLISDTLARSLISNLELPVSIFLVIIGVPFLISLLLRKTPLHVE